MSPTLLIIEDEALLGQELQRHFQREGWETRRAANLDEARAILWGHAFEPAVVLSDMNLPDGNALDLLDDARRAALPGEWVFITGYGSVPDSVRAVKLGALDFLEKPVDIGRLTLVLNGAARTARAERRLAEQAADEERRYEPASYAGDSAAAQETREMLARLAQVPFSALLIGGETGTGKGLAARILHYAGARKSGPLVEVNCAALPHELIEGELFGHEAGAFTGAKGRRRGLVEQASGGTLFLDELGELPPELQVKLLKVIEDKAVRRLGSERTIAVDVQFVAASNRDLETEVREGRFRADLFHRLSVFRLNLPPLRARSEDVRQLVPQFVREFNAKAGKRVTRIPDAVWTRLLAHDWPGNVRELKNLAERWSLGLEPSATPEHWPSTALADTLARTERACIEAALAAHGGNVALAAQQLDVPRKTLYDKLSRLSLDPARFRSAND